jgi:hypothetical protein
MTIRPEPPNPCFSPSYTPNMDISELSPTESDRVHRRDRKRVTAMVVDGGNVRRQLEGLRAREWRRQQEQVDKTAATESSEALPG